MQFFENLMLRKIRCACSTMMEGRGAYRVWVSRPEGKKPLGKSRHR